MTEYGTRLSSGLPGAVAWLDREFDRRPAGELVRERRDWKFMRAELMEEAVELGEEQVGVKFREVLMTKLMK